MRSGTASEVWRCSLHRLVREDSVVHSLRRLIRTSVRSDWEFVMELYSEWSV